MAAVLTPNGRALGRKAPTPDRLGRDRLYGLTHEAAGAPVALPPSIDLRGQLPPVVDQGQTQACGGCAGAALASYLFPKLQEYGGASALQVYYDARLLAGDEGADVGVETRNVLKALNKTGAIASNLWPLDAKRVLAAPPRDPIYRKIGSYALLGGAQDYLSCLAARFPIVLGIMVPESLDGADVDRTGILQLPDLSQERILGGHDVLVVGYATGFRASPLLRGTGIDPKRVDDTMLLVRNSWGPEWSKRFRGHFWLPLSWAVNPTTGGDAWTGRLATSMAEAAPIDHKPKATQRQMDACFRSIRNSLDNETSYGGWVSDEKLRPFTDKAAIATVEAG